MENVFQYDIIEITLKSGTTLIGSFHSMIDDEIILYIPSRIDHIPITDTQVIKRIKKATDYDSSKVAQFFKHSSYTYTKRYELQDKLHIRFDNDTFADATIVEIEDDCLILELEDKEKLYINFNYKKELPIGITQISRNVQEEEDVNETDQEVIIYNIDESKCQYTLNVQINSILQYMNFTKKYNGEQFAQRYKELMLTFPYGQPITPDQTKFKWISPITDATIKINNLQKNMQFKKSLTNSLMCYKNLELTNKDKQYNSIQKFIHSIFRVFADEYPLSPIQTYLLPTSTIMMFKHVKGSKELDLNWVPKIQHWNDYTTDELLPITGYTAFPPTSIAFSKLYLPESGLMQKVQLNLISHLHKFNLKCEPDFAFKEFKNYADSIPSVKSFIPTLTYYSLHDFIRQLEPYHIYANHIEYDTIALIQSNITKRKNKFLSAKQTVTYLTLPTQTNKLYEKTYISTSELYAHALFNDYGNVFIRSNLKPVAPLKEEPPKPSKEETKFVLNPPEPTCEVKDDCSTDNTKQLTNFLLTNYHSSDVTVVNPENVSFLKRKQKFNENQQLKYNTKFNKIQSDLHPERPPQSYELFYQIMSFPLKKRYTALLQFITKYTKPNSANPLLLDCSTTNIPLVPVILKTLAETYLSTTLEEYYTVLYKYCTSSPHVYVEDGFYKDKNTSISLAPILSANSYDEITHASEIESDVQYQTTYTAEQQKFMNVLSTLCTILIQQPKLNQLDHMFINDTIVSKPKKIILYFLIYIHHIKMQHSCETIAQEIVKSIALLEKYDPSLLQEIGKKIVVSEIKRICAYVDEKYKVTTKKVVVKEYKEWKTFMPSTVSTYPVIEAIKTQLQKSDPIHKLHDDLKRVNNVLIDFSFKDVPFPHPHKPMFSSYVNKFDIPAFPELEFSFDIPHPLVFKHALNKKLDLDIPYETQYNLRELQDLQKSYAKHISKMNFQHVFEQYPSLYIANFIKTILQFYAKICTNMDFYTTLYESPIPITHTDLIARSHFESIHTQIRNYYKDPPINSDSLTPLWHELSANENIQQILRELNQPLHDENMNVILFFYLLQIFKEIDLIKKKGRDDTVLKYISKKFNSELAIPDYADLKKKMTIRQSLERKTVVNRSKQLSETEKLLTSIQTNLNTSTKYNVPQFTSRLNEALLFQGLVNKDAEGDAGDDGNLEDNNT
jgi:hypothetical protein